MFSARSLALTLHLGLLAAERSSASSTIQWFPCTQNGTLPIICGSLTVPLDYTDTSSNATLNLDLVKIEAVKQPKKGTILFNPGGPGEGGRDLLLGQFGSPIQIITGGVYDLVAFDTRGTGRTIPFSCYKDPAERVISQIRTPVYLNSSDTAIGTSWAARTTLVQSCYENAKDIGEIVGTGYIARDMMQIVDALQEGGLLNYWGFSYGTALGATVAALFPDRMDKVVLDGVLNPHDYYAGRDVSETTSSDETLDGFFTGCVANPGNCALAADGTTAEGLKQKIYNFFDEVKFNPLVAGGNITTDIIDYTVVKLVIQTALYGPASWPGLALAFHDLFQGNYTTFLALVAGSAPQPIYPNYGPEAAQGIRAGDTRLRTDNLTDLYPLIDEFYATSRIFGDSLSSQALTYAQWPFQAKGAYTGDFCVKTRNPVLFIGNSFDPFTPLVSARNASAGFEGSVVLEHQGYGHCSTAQPSLCTAKALRAYFVNGTLPAEGTKCSVTIPLFSNETSFVQALAPIANFSKRALNEEDDDALLVRAMAQLHESIPHIRF